MKVVMSPGSKLEIEFADSDGRFGIEFKDATNESAGHILITSDLPDPSGRVGEIYKEVFGDPAEFNRIVEQTT
jgi:hypothetical protein